MTHNISPIDLLPLIEDINPSGYAVLSYFVFTPQEEVWISYKSLKDKTTLGVRTLMQVVSHLEALGILSVQRFPAGSGEVNRYKVNMKQLQVLIEERKAEREVTRITSSTPFQDSSFSTPPEGPPAPLSGCLTDPAQPTAPFSGLPDTDEPQTQIDSHYLTLAQRVQDGQVRPELLKWLRDTKMLSPSGELDLNRLTTTFPFFQDFCSAFEQRVTEDKNLENETCSLIDGLNLVQPPATEHDSTADIINSLVKHFDAKGV
jgi:hypothetical protein